MKKLQKKDIAHSCIIAVLVLAVAFLLFLRWAGRQRVYQVEKDGKLIALPLTEEVDAITSKDKSAVLGIKRHILNRMQDVSQTDVFIDRYGYLAEDQIDGVRIYMVRDSGTLSQEERAYILSVVQELTAGGETKTSICICQPA